MCFDTRTAASPSGPIPAGGEVSVVHAGTAGLPTTGVAALSLNVTATQTAGTGFITGFPTGTTRPLASILNITFAGETRPNAAFLPVGTGGQISYYSLFGTHLIADTNGYFKN